MRAAVVGTGWGRVHIAALQELGVDVVALCGTNLVQTRAVADEHGIPDALTGVDRLPHLGLDLITIAAPTALHADLVAQLGPTPLLCEKPAVGVEVPVAQLRPPTGPVWVNYAFPFLDAAREANRLLVGWAETAEWPREGLEGSGPAGSGWVSDAGDIGAVLGVHVHSEYDLGALVQEERSSWQWLSDVASHPWSWAVARFGLPAADVCALPSDAAAFSYTSEFGVPVSVSAQHSPGLAGLRHSLEVRGTFGDLNFRGQFRLGHAWQFDPPRFHPKPGGERPTAWQPGLPSLARVSTQGPVTLPSHSDSHDGGGDPWHRANIAAIAAVVDAIRVGGSSGLPGPSVESAAVRHGQGPLPANPPLPFTWSQALAMDACVQAAAHNTE